MSFLRRCLYGEMQVTASIYCQEILSITGAFRPKNLLRRRIDAQNFSRVIKKHKALLHVAGHLRKFICLFLQAVKLRGDLLPLLMDAAEKGR